MIAIIISFFIVPMSASLADFCQLLPEDDLAHVVECSGPYEWLEAAEVPAALWPEFLAVAACEGGLEPEPDHGDDGAARGLLQIHWFLWSAWANENHGRNYGPDDWADPVLNLELGLLIQEEYSLARGDLRWSQWGSSPSWSICQDRRDAILQEAGP